MTERKSKEVLVEENRQLRTRVEELEAVLHAIRSGKVDALVLSKPAGEQVLPLQGALEPYRIMVEAMGEGAVSLSAESTILYCNARFVELVRMPRERIIGLPLHDMIAEPDRKTFDEMISRGLQELMRGELTLLASDGMRIPVHLSMCPLPESDGKAVSVVVTDLTEVFAAAQTRTLLALIIESSDDAIVSTTLDGVVKSWNRAAEQLYGYTADEVIGHPIESLIVPPERSDEVIQELEAIGQGEFTLLEETVRQRKDGTQLAVSVKASPILDEAGKVIGASINARDITQQKRMQKERDRATHLLGERLKEISCLHAISTIVGESELSIEQRLQRIVERISSGFRYPDVTCARITLADSQYSSADFQETAWRLACDIEVEEEGEEGGSLEVFYTEERPASDEGPFLREERDLVNTLGRILGDFLRLEHSLSQLTRFRDLVDASNDGVFVIDPGSACILDVNRQACDALGYSRDELLRLRVIDIEVTLPNASAWDEHIREVKKGGSMLLEGEEKRKDGRTFPAEVSIRYVARNEGDYIVAIVRDITERKRAEEALQESEEEFRTLAESMPQIVWITRPDGWNIYFNQQWVDYTGLTLEESRGHGWNKPFHPDDQKYAWDAWGNATKNLAPYSIESRLRRADGVYRWWLVRGVPLTDDKGNILKWFGTCTDIHDLKTAEQEIIKTNRALKTLSAGNLALVQATNEDELLQTVTRVIVEQGDYAQAVVDYAEDDPEKSITPRAWSGYEGDPYWAEQLSWADTEQGQLPVSRAIRSGKTQVSHDIASDPAFEPWRERVAALGYVSNIALPMSDGKRIFGALSIYSTVVLDFDDEEIRLLEELGNNLAYGIAALRVRTAHEQDADILRQSLEQSIQTIAAIVEARDPYTAGHQRRVAELATAIAREMALTEDQVNAIYFAAIIHDLGKIHIPAEILSKPSKLNDIEFMLVKTHPQAGYDILKNVIFPWPIADIVLQHHERLDGSGYPQGLKGGDILLEARIITIADVIEAMSSHRPYRPGLGIESALKEIECHRGEWYDPKAVDACLKLFREDGYTLPA